MDGFFSLTQIIALKKKKLFPYCGTFNFVSKTHPQETPNSSAGGENRPHVTDLHSHVS